MVEVPPLYLLGGFKVQDEKRDYDDAVETVAADRS